MKVDMKKVKKNFPKEVHKNIECLFLDSIILIAERLFGILTASFSVFIGVFSRTVSVDHKIFRYLCDIPFITSFIVIFLSIIMLILFDQSKKRLLLYKIITCFEYVILIAAESCYVWQFRNSKNEFGAVIFAVFLLYIMLIVLGAVNVFRIKPEENERS